MDAIVGLITFVLLFTATTLWVGSLDRWAARPGPGAISPLRGDVSAALTLRGGFESAVASLRAVPLPMFVGGWLMVILDGGGGGGGRASSSSDADVAHRLASAEASLREIDPVLLGAIAVAALVAGLACAAVFLAIRAFVAVGWVRLQREALVSGSGSFATLFSGGDRWMPMLGWLVLRASISVIPFAVTALVGLAVLAAAGFTVPSAPGFVVVAVAMVAAFIQTISIASSLVLGDYLVALEGASPLAALRGSLAATRGHRLQIIGFAIVWLVLQALVAVSGVLACCVGLVVTIPFARALHDNAWCRSYLLARDGEDAPRSWAGAAG